MKRILIFLVLLNAMVFSAVEVEKTKLIPTKYKPTGITVDKDGNIYASSSFVGVIIKYSKDFKQQYVLRFKDVKNITDVFAYENSLFVLLGGGSILEFDFDGNLKKQLDFPKGGLIGELDNPSGLYIEKNTIYIADTLNSRIVSMNFEGKNIKSFGYKSVFIDGFISPVGISKLAQYYVISDESTKEIKLFDKDGLYFGNFKNQENEENFLVSPQEIFVDDKNSVYVVDSGRNQIFIFSIDGKIKNVGEKGYTKNKFYGPKDIWVDNKYIYVADTMNEKIKILDRNNFTVVKVIGKRNVIYMYLAGFLALILVIFIANKGKKVRKGEKFEE